MHLNRPLRIVGGVHKGSRDVEVGVGFVNLGVGAVAPVSEERVREPDGTIMAADIPLIWVRPGDGERLTVFVGGFHVVNVLSKLVQSVTSR